MNQEREQINPREYDRPIPKNELPPLEFFPEREWLDAKVESVEYRYVYRKGYIQYLQNSNKEDILDDDGEKIPRKEFNITFVMLNYELPNGDPRKGWLSLGASMSDRAYLPKVLKKFGNDHDDPTPQQIIDTFAGKDVRFQVANKVSEANGKEYQNIIWDSVKPASQKDSPAAGNGIHCACDAKTVKTNPEGFCLECGKLVTAWDE